MANDILKHIEDANRAANRALMNGDELGFRLARLEMGATAGREPEDIPAESCGYVVTDAGCAVLDLVERERAVLLSPSAFEHYIETSTRPVVCRRCGDEEFGPWGTCNRGGSVWSGCLLCETCLDQVETAERDTEPPAPVGVTELCAFAPPSPKPTDTEN